MKKLVKKVKKLWLVIGCTLCIFGAQIVQAGNIAEELRAEELRAAFSQISIDSVGYDMEDIEIDNAETAIHVIECWEQYKAATTPEAKKAALTEMFDFNIAD
jgi:hypothetical protein